MDEYIRQLQAYVREYKIIFEEDCPQPCLDALWWHYGEYHNMDSSQAKKGFKNLRACLDSLPIKDSDVVVGEVGCLCAEYERIRSIFPARASRIMRLKPSRRLVLTALIQHPHFRRIQQLPPGDLPVGGVVSAAPGAFAISV